MSVDQYFSQSYGEARKKFIDHAKASRFVVTEFANEDFKSPEGGLLSMDIAVKGPIEAKNVIVISSGTHGVEGYCGSGIQSALFGERVFGEMSSDCRVVMIHAVNPFGFAHDRRVNEDNIDLNRNFFDFSDQLPSDDKYAEIHDWLVPAEWDGDIREKADMALAEYMGRVGMPQFQEAASGGQYSFANGLFYGGRKSSWSADTYLNIVAELGQHAEQLIFIDFHTGLGPYGHGELISLGSDVQKQRTAKFYSNFEVTDPDAGTSSSAPLNGTMGHGVERVLPDKDLVFVALEYGTLPGTEVMAAVRADNWLYANGDLNSELGTSIKRQIRDAFYCDQSDWKEMVWRRAHDVVSSTLDNLRS